MTCLTHIEIMESIGQYLKIKQSELSILEQNLYLNIASGIQAAHTNTLSKWLHLISAQREATIRRQREINCKVEEMKTISTYF